jgi:hypothetical protein
VRHAKLLPILDLTPPVCTSMEDIISLLPAPTFFSTRSGYAGQWRCDDPESGVSFTSWMPYLQPEATSLYSEALLTRRWFTKGVAGIGAGSGVAGVSQLVHGGKYFSCVSATNRAYQDSTIELCSEGTTFDGFAPPVKGGFLADFENKRFVRGHDELCSRYPLLIEDVSTISKLEHELVKVYAGEENVIKTVVVNTSYASDRDVHCFPLDSPLEHRARYFSRLRATDSATPVNVREVESRGFYVDTTPPTAGNVSVSPVFPDEFAAQTDFSSVTGLVVRVETSGYATRGFTDDDSGVARVEVQIFADGVFIATGAIPPRSDEFESMPLPQLANGTVLQAFAYAVNRVNMTSETRASPTFQLILGAITFKRPWFALGDGSAVSSLFYNDTYQIAVGFERAFDPMQSQGSGELRYGWGIAEGPCVAGVAEPVLAADGQSPNTTANSTRVAWYGLVADNFAYHTVPPAPVLRGPRFAPKSVRRGTERSTELVNNDPLFLVKTFDAQLQHGQSYCGTVTVCAMPTEDLTERCVTALTRQIVVDVTPPSAQCSQPQPVTASGPTAQYDVRVACSDVESGVVSARLSLGTKQHPTLYLSDYVFDIADDDEDDALTTSEGANAAPT